MAASGRMARWVTALEAMYTWQQEDEQVTITVPMPEGINKSDVNVIIKSNELSVAFGDRDPVMKGQLFDRISESGSMWGIVADKNALRVLSISLEKSTSIEWPHIMKFTGEDADMSYDSHSLFEIAAVRESVSDMDTAFQYFKLAAEKGHINAQLKLAAIYMVGNRGSRYPVEMSLEESFRWHLAAAEQGSSEGQFFVANSYHFAHGAEKNFKEAVTWYERAIETTLVQISEATIPYLVTAMYNAGLLYQLGGFGLDADIEKAVMWWNRAEKMGSAQAAYNLAVTYLKGADTIEQDIDKAMSYFERASKLDPRFSVPTEEQLAEVLGSAVPLPSTLEKEKPEESPKPKAKQSSKGHRGPSVSTMKKRLSGTRPTRAKSASPSLAKPTTKTPKNSSSSESETTTASTTSLSDWVLIGAAAFVAAAAFIYTTRR